MVFIKKHYKKFLIFCSLFILSFTVLFSQPNEVNAYGLILNNSTYFSSSSYIDFPVSNNVPDYRVDLPSTYNGSTNFSLTGDIFNVPLTLEFTQNVSDLANSDSILYSNSGYFGTTLYWINNHGQHTFHTSSILFDSSALDASSGLFPFFVIIDAAPSEVITCDYSFSYLLYNEDSKTLSSHSYSNSFVMSHNLSDNDFLHFSVIEDFVNTLSVDYDYDYYYFYDIDLTFSSTEYRSTDSYFVFPLSTDIIDNYQSFIDLNNFDFGLTDSEIDAIYNEGYASGVESVNTQDYYNQGYTHASEDFLKFENLVFGVMNGFTNTISQLFDFEIFGISIFALIGGLVAVAFGVGITIIVIKIIKIFT